MPESPGTPWLDDDYRCRYWTGHDNFLYSDELPGGLAVPCFPNAVRLFMASRVHVFDAPMTASCGEAAMPSWDQSKRKLRARALSPRRTLSPARTACQAPSDARAGGENSAACSPVEILSVQ